MASIETLEDIKARIEQVTAAEAREELASGEAVLIDTRDAINRQEIRIEGDEFAPAGNGGIESAQRGVRRAGRGARRRARQARGPLLPRRQPLGRAPRTR